MSWTKLFIIAVLALLLPPASARADEPQTVKMDWSAKLDAPLTTTVRDACQSKNAVDLAFCYGEIMSAYDANLYFADIMAVHPLCIPDNATPEQLRQAFLRVVAMRPTQLTGNFSIFFYVGLNQQYPCTGDDWSISSKINPPPPSKTVPAGQSPVQMTTPDSTPIK